MLDEGSVLCLDNRTPLGRIEDIIGPVAEPLYLLRYAGPEPMPEAVRPGARVSSVPSHSKYILQEKIEVSLPPFPDHWSRMTSGVAIY